MEVYINAADYYFLGVGELSLNMDKRRISCFHGPNRPTYGGALLRFVHITHRLLYTTKLMPQNAGQPHTTIKINLYALPKSIEDEKTRQQLVSDIEARFPTASQEGRLKLELDSECRLRL